jgi:hypothetical protein
MKSILSVMALSILFGSSLAKAQEIPLADHLDFSCSAYQTISVKQGTIYKFLSARHGIPVPLSEPVHPPRPQGPRESGRQNYNPISKAILAGITFGLIKDPYDPKNNLPAPTQSDLQSETIIELFGGSWDDFHTLLTIPKESFDDLLKNNESAKLKTLVENFNLEHPGPLDCRISPDGSGDRLVLVTVDNRCYEISVDDNFTLVRSDCGDTAEVYKFKVKNHSVP